MIFFGSGGHFFARIPQIHEMHSIDRSLDPYAHSPYVGNFHHGHTVKSANLLDDPSKKRLKYRWSSQPDMNSISSDNSFSSRIRDPQALAAWRQGKATACLGKLNGIMEHSEDEYVPFEPQKATQHCPAEKRPAVHRSYSDPIFSLRERLELDGIPATPELCALQAILPKQVLHL